MVPSRSSSTSHDDSGRSRSVCAEESWRDGEGDVSGSHGHGKERQMDYEGVNTSFGSDIVKCFVCHRHGHFARECPVSTQRYRRDGGGRQGLGSDWRHQSRGQVSRNFRGSGGQSFGGSRFAQPYSQTFEQQVGQQNGLPIPCQRCGGRRPHSFNDCPGAGAVCYNCGRQGHLSTVCLQAQSK